MSHSFETITLSFFGRASHMGNVVPIAGAMERSAGSVCSFSIFALYEECFHFELLHCQICQRCVTACTVREHLTHCILMVLDLGKVGNCCNCSSIIFF